MFRLVSQTQFMMQNMHFPPQTKMRPPPSQSYIAMMHYFSLTPQHLRCRRISTQSFEPIQLWETHRWAVATLFVGWLFYIKPMHIKLKTPWEKVWYVIWCRGTPLVSSSSWSCGFLAKINLVLKVHDIDIDHIGVGRLRMFPFWFLKWTGVQNWFQTWGEIACSHCAHHRRGFGVQGCVLGGKKSFKFSKFLQRSWPLPKRTCKGLGKPKPASIRVKNTSSVDGIRLFSDWFVLRHVQNLSGLWSYNHF